MWQYTIPSEKTTQVLAFLNREKVKFLTDGDDHDTVFVERFSDLSLIEQFILSL